MFSPPSFTETAGDQLIIDFYVYLPVVHKLEAMKIIKAFSWQ